MQWLASLLFASLLASSNGNLPLSTFQNQTLNQVISEKAGYETERFEQTYPFSSNGKISISNINGSITVEAWDKNEIKLESVKNGESKERLAEVKLKIDAGQTLFSVETDYGSWQNGRNGNWGKNGGNIQVDFHLYVPKNAYLDEIETINGTVNISNMQNFTKASAVNGEVRAVNLRGSADISTVNGTTVAEFDSLQSTDKIALSTVNGRVNLAIPSDADATIKAETVNGGINNEFGLPVKKGKYVGRDLYGKLGTGTVKISLESVNGPLNITRKKDGREMKPVTNLLPTKDKDEDEDCDDCEDSEDSSVISRKMQRDIERTSRDAQRQSRIAIGQTAEQLKNLNLNIEIQDESFDESRQNLVEAQQELKEAQESLKEAEKDTESSKEEREEAVKDAKESLKQAQKLLKNTQREFANAQKAMSRSSRSRRNSVIPVAPVAPVLPVGPLGPLGIIDGNISFSIGNQNDGDFSYGNATVEKNTDSAVVKGVPKITVEGIDSEVVVTSWDKAEVEYTITQVSKSKSDITFDVKKSDSEISIKAIDNRRPLERTGNLRGSYELKGDKVYDAYRIRIELTVPRKSDLKIIGSDGNIRIDGVSGDLDINNSDGKVSVRDSSGKLRITNSDGNVRVIGFKGELDAKTSDGNYYLEGDFSRIDAESTDGNFILTLSENSNADIQANVEELETIGISATKKSDNLWQIGKGGAKFTFNVSDGSVKVRSSSQVKN
jgi:hypothetical protein